MTIEFNTDYGKVSEKLVWNITNEIMELVHIDKKVSRVEVLLKEDETIIPGENKVCEIKFSVYGDDLVVHARTPNYKSAAKDAIKELKRLINHQVLKKQVMH